MPLLMRLVQRTYCLKATQSTPVHELITLAYIAMKKTIESASIFKHCLSGEKRNVIHLDL